MKKEQKRLLILRAAEELFFSRRFDQVTMEDVCLKARVGKGTIYRYFKDKDELFAEVMLTDLDDLHELLKQKTDKADAPDAKLLAAARALHDFHRRRHSVFRSLHGEWMRAAFGCGKMREEFHKRRERTAALLASIIESGAKAGRYRADVPPPVAARMFLAVLRAGASGGMEGGGARVPIQKTIEVFLEGMRRR